MAYIVRRRFNDDREIDSPAEADPAAQRKRVGDTRDCLDRAVRHPGYDRLFVAQASRQRPPSMEMKGAKG